MSRIAEYPKRSTYIDPIATIILGQFLLGPHFSTYQVHKALKEIPIKNMQRKKKGKSYLLAYKDVHKRVKRLYSLGLIEESGIDQLPRKKISSYTQFDMKFASIHNPIFYRLTLGGIFNLVLYHVAETVEPPTAIFRYHNNNIIFRTFLYSFFKKSTLTRIKGSFLLRSVFIYLSRCCEIIDHTLAILSNNNNLKVLIPLFNWNDIPGRNNKTVIEMISDEFNINLSESSNIKKINNKEIEISDKRNLIIIRLEDKYEATLIVNPKKVYTLGLEKSGDKLVVSKIGIFREDIALPLLDCHARYNLLNLASSITMGVMVGHTQDEFIEFIAELDIEDFGILSKDHKAMNILKEACKAHLNGYKAMSKLEKMKTSSLRV
ncbi:MAG: hypothetical protein ACRD47_01690 [Nitrososphaeraceae archaeon]